MANEKTKSYHQLFDLLSEFDIESLEDYERIYQPYDRKWKNGEWLSHGELDEAVTEYLIDTLNEEEKRINYANGSKFIFRASSKQLEPVLLNKIVLFSTLSVTLSPRIFFASGDLIPNYYISVPNEFYIALLQAKPLIKEKIFSVIPSAIDHDVYTSGYHPDWKPIKINLPEVSVSHNDLNKQLTENEISNMPNGYTAIYLPHLRGISIDTMLKIRNDEGDAFIRFQKKIESLFRVAEGFQSEEKLLDVMREVDYEIRILNEKYRQLQRKRSLQIAQVTLGIICLILVQFAPKEISKEVSKFLGSLTIFDAIKQITKTQIEKGSFKESDFYIPWKISQIK